MTVCCSHFSAIINNPLSLKYAQIRSHFVCAQIFGLYFKEKWFAAKHPYFPLKNLWVDGFQ